MCLRTSSIRPYQKWNWNGSEIVHDTDIPTTRTLTKGNKIIHKFPTDIRQFITIENNAVVKKVISKIIDALPRKEQESIYKNKKESFDLRVRKCQEYLACMEYARSNSKYDDWQFPEETIKLKGGDCEDMAFLLASLILTIGISDYCVRVAFGNVIEYDGDKSNSHEHCWVMYQNEQGVWEIIEPLLYVQPAKDEAPTYLATSTVFTPPRMSNTCHYVFNRSHLWSVRTYDSETGNDFQGYLLSKRKYFNKVDPGFATKIHNSIFQQALKGMSSSDLQKVMRTSLYIDANTLIYDPRDHFDFAYIDEGWERVRQRLSTKDLGDFAKAVHAVGDFYAHSFYGYFAVDAAGHIPVYNPAKPLDPVRLKYDFKGLGDLKGCKLSTCKPGTAKAEDLWNGKLISGQWWRFYAPIPNDIQDRPDFCTRRCIPDHDAVAVDSENFDPNKHKVCKSPFEYKIQFEARVKAAIDHISLIYQQWQHS